METVSGQRLRDLRCESGASLREASAEVGVNAGTWSRWETGARAIPIDSVALIEETLDVPLGSLFRPRIREALVESVGGSLDPRLVEFVDDATDCAVAIYLELWGDRDRPAQWPHEEE